MNIINKDFSDKIAQLYKQDPDADTAFLERLGSQSDSETQSRAREAAEPRKSSTASNIARIATYVSLVLGTISLGKYSVDNSASVAGKRARTSLLATLPENTDLTPADKKTLECLVGRIGVRCQGVSRLGKDDFESQNCDHAALDALDDPDKSKTENLMALGDKAREVTAKAKITPRFMCESSKEGSQLKITLDEPSSSKTEPPKPTPSESTPSPENQEDVKPRPGRNRRPSLTENA
ncbi:MAG: hypothetical protein Q8P62_00100 [Candidatus Peregrinibacteria bacterium]|nr:hypothetical protein [Candidatus Peregrinibacteria bacterium]